MQKKNETYKKIIETLKKNIKKEEEFYLAKEQIDSIIKDIIEDYDTLFEKYDEKIKNLEEAQLESMKKIDNLENRVKYFEKMLEMEDYDIFVTCPYCGYEFQTDYDEEISEIPCPECGRIIDIDWSDNEEDSDDEDECEEE